MDNKRVLVVELCDEPTIPPEALRAAGWGVLTARSVKEALEELQSAAAAVGIVSFDTPGVRALFEAEDLLFSSGPVEWVAVVPSPCLQDPSVRRIILERFSDYHRLPIDLGRLLVTLGHAHGRAAMMRNQPALCWTTVDGHEIVGQSPAMRQFFRDVEKIAGTDAPVLIAGESGTGKEVAAKAIHRLSRRSEGPFVAVNCGALPSGLIQSELFGYEKGAFTGAERPKVGRFELAQGGTILLDEIGDLSPDLQVNLLRFLQESTIDRVGGGQPIRLDVRVLAATHVDLERAVAEGRFRSDLYYRLNVLRLAVPPLREREGDMELLARYFFQKFRRERNRRLGGFSQAAIRALKCHGWPGNIRELVNRVRRAVVMCDNCLITPADLGLDGQTAARPPATLAEARAAAERDAISSALAAAGGNLSESARKLGVSRVTLYRLLEKHGVSV